MAIKNTDKKAIKKSVTKVTKKVASKTASKKVSTVVNKTVKKIAKKVTPKAIAKTKPVAPKNKSTKNTSSNTLVITKTTTKKEIIVVTSGGFDPIHIGHVRLINEAKKLGDKLIVILNNDHWIKLKKGQPFMSQEERKEILEALGSVDEVVYSSHTAGTTDMSIIKDLEKIRPHIFAKGGDRHIGNIPETPICNAIGCIIVGDLGHGGKVQSSSWLIARAKEYEEKTAQSQKPSKKAIKKGKK